MKNFLLGIVLSLFATFTVAKSYDTNPVVPVVTTVDNRVSGYWETNSPYGLGVVLVYGNYYVSSSWGGTTCGNVLRFDVAVPKSYPYNTSFYGKGEVVNPSGPIGYGDTVTLLSPGKSGVVGQIRLVSYNSLADSITVELTSTGIGPNGTFQMQRVALAPKTLAAPTCP